MNQPFEFKPISDSEQDAKAVQFMTLTDIEAGQHPDSLTVANPNNKQLVDTQRAKHAHHPEQYRGAYDEHGELVGYIKVDNWYYGLEVPFTSGIEKQLLIARKFVTRRHVLPGNPLGIMGLVADPRLAEHYTQEVVNDMLIGLVDYAIEVAESGETVREIKVPHYAGDPAREATTAQGFVYSGKSGELFDIKQDLYVRTPR